MKLNKNRDLTEIQQIRKACKDVGLDYDEIKLRAVYDMNGNILSIDTKDKKIIAWLKEKGFEE